MTTEACPVANKPATQPPAATPVNADGSPLKPCCACPATRKARDECILREGSEEACSSYIEQHKACLRSYGFIID